MSDQGDIGTIVGNSGDPAVNRDTFGTDLKDIEDRLELLIAEVTAARGSESTLQDALDAKQGTDQRNEDSGYAGLNSSGNVPADRLPDSTEFTTNKNNPNGYAGLDADGDILESVLPSSVTGLQSQIDAKQGLSQKGQASGYAGLGADAKVPLAQLPDVVSSLVTTNLGAWNASTNTPTIPAASSSNNGSYYVVTVAGSTDIDGETNWQIGDMLISNGTIWERVPFSQIDKVYATTADIKALSTSDVAAGDVLTRLQYASGHQILPVRFRVIAGGLSSQSDSTEHQGIWFENNDQTLTFIVIHNGTIDGRWAGAIADGSAATDSALAVNACNAFAVVRGGADILLPAEGNYYTFATTVTISGGNSFSGTGQPTSRYWQLSSPASVAANPYDTENNFGTVIWLGSGFTGSAIDAGGANDKGVNVSDLTIDMRNAGAGSSLGDIVGLTDRGTWHCNLRRIQVCNLANNNCVGIERGNDTGTGVSIYEQCFVGQNGSSGTGAWAQNGTGILINFGAHITLKTCWVRYTEHGYDYDTLGGNNFQFDCTAENVSGDAINVDGTAELVCFGGEYTSDTNCTVGNVFLNYPGTLSGAQSSGTGRLQYDDQSLNIFLNGDQKEFDINFNGSSAFRVRNLDAANSRPQFIVQSNFLGAASPTFSFSGDEDTGFYRVGANSVGMACGGSLVCTWTSTGINSTAIGANTPSTGAFSTLTTNKVINTKSSYTIISGSISAPTTKYITVDTEGSASTDDLETIGAGTDGEEIIVVAANSNRTVVAKDGVGNLDLSGDFSMDSARDKLHLMYQSNISAWSEISRSNNSA